jgi:hypothetical protein
MHGQGYHAGRRVMATKEQWQDDDWQGQAELGQKQAKCNVTQHESPKNTIKTKTKTKLRGLSSRANYTDRAAAAGRRS